MLSFCLDDLFTDGIRLLKTSTTIMLRAISPFRFANNFLIYFDFPILGSVILIVDEMSVYHEYCPYLSLAAFWLAVYFV